MLEVKRFEFNDFRENTYLVWDDDSKEAIIVDPGCYSNAEEMELDNFVKNNNLTIKYIFNTHCHLDHIFGNKFCKENFDSKILIHSEDVFLFELQIEQAERYGLKMKASPKADILLKENDVFLIGEIELKILHTPGHSPGEVCLYFENEKICFTGDVLFREGIGRTDLWGGDYFVLMDSIQDVLLTLPEETIIYPGHGLDSTIGYEKNNNSFL